VREVVAKQANAVVFPREMFAHTLEHPSQYSSLTTGSARMVRYDKPDEILIYSSGQAIVTDSNKKRAGCAVIFETEDNPMSNPVAFPLEKEGLSTPFAAALRALVAAPRAQDMGLGGMEAGGHCNGRQESLPGNHPRHY
jgi:hypothetical protein